MSLDIVDMYFAINIKILTEILETKILTQGASEFQSSVGMSVASFLDLFNLYLQSTVVKDTDQYFRQKTGLPIGTKVAPHASEIFLESVDLAIYNQLKTHIDQGKIIIRRFVDDYLLICEEGLYDPENFIKIFTTHGKGLNFTHEFEPHSGLQYLDLRISTDTNGICWWYEQRSDKPLLPFASYHASRIRNSIAITTIKTSIERSCECKLHTSLKCQETRLLNAGFPEGLISSTKRKLIDSFTPTQLPSGRLISDTVSIPYAHGISNRLSKAASKFNIRIVTTYKHKLRHTLLTHKKLDHVTCSNDHKGLDFFPCAKGVVYQLGLTCGSLYIGESSRCANTRLKDHKASLTKSCYSNLKDHVKTCGCKFDNTTSQLAAGPNIKGLFSRRLCETIVTEQKPDPRLILSQTSITPTDGERNFIEYFCQKVFLKH